MQTVLVVGRGGQLSMALQDNENTFRKLGFRLVDLGLPECDLMQLETIAPQIAAMRPAVIINAAAYTAVDQAEDEPEMAMRLNAEAPREMARAAQKLGARLIHISTDYVYAGTKKGPYIESDPVAPVTVYGITKARGEQYIREALPEGHVILRTAWLYSSYGSNFVKTMLALAKTRDRVSVVNDQIGNPTSAHDLSDAILGILRHWTAGLDRSSFDSTALPHTGLGRTFHYTGAGAVSWCEFAQGIFASSKEFGGPSATVTPVGSAEWPAKATRPANSQLDSSAFRETFALELPPWQSSLDHVVRRLLL